eukprot:365598-Chlamydomonas_euryale.AAC.11
MEGAPGGGKRLRSQLCEGRVHAGKWRADGRRGPVWGPACLQHDAGPDVPPSTCTKTFPRLLASAGFSNLSCGTGQYFLSSPLTLAVARPSVP